MTGENHDTTLRYRYTFQFEDETVKQFETRLDARTLELLPQRELPKPEWTKLKYCQCENCPLGDEGEYCPVAVNLSELVKRLKTSHRMWIPGSS